MPPADLGGLLADRAATTPGSTAVSDEAGRTFTYRELDHRVEQLAQELGSLGLRAGSRVAWQLPTSTEAVALVAALSRLGVVQAPLLPTYGERELAVVFEDVVPEVAITRSTWRGRALQTTIEDVVARTGAGSAVAVLDDIDDVPRVVSTSSAPTSPAPELPAAAAWVFFTSGTTGRARGAIHSDAGLLAGPRALVNAYALGTADVIPIVFPLTHVGGVQMLAAQFLAGARAVLYEAFEPGLTFRDMGRDGVTLLAGGTPMAELALEEQRSSGVRLLPGLRGVVVGAAPKRATLHQELQARFGAGALSCYGLTEAPMGVLGSTTDPDWARAETEGRPIPNSDVRAVRPDGTVCAPDEIGELCVRGPHVMLGALATQATTTDATDGEGWLRTGDLGSISEERYVRVVGRLKDVVIRKGENISAPEVEAVLATMPGVSDVVVVGLPDPVAGERCCMVATPDGSGAPITLDAARLHCAAAGLATYKWPEHIAVVPELSRNASGKVVKQTLVDQLMARDSTQLEQSNGR